MAGIVWLEDGRDWVKSKVLGCEYQIFGGCKLSVIANAIFLNNMIKPHLGGKAQNLFGGQISSKADRIGRGGNLRVLIDRDRADDRLY